MLSLSRSAASAALDAGRAALSVPHCPSLGSVSALLNLVRFLVVGSITSGTTPSCVISTRGSHFLE